MNGQYLSNSKERNRETERNELSERRIATLHLIVFENSNSVFKFFFYIYDLIFLMICIKIDDRFILVYELFFLYTQTFGLQY